MSDREPDDVPTPRAWDVGGAIPPADKRSWSRTIVVHVVAMTAARAIQLVEQRHPGIVIHTVQHRGRLDIIEDTVDSLRRELVAVRQERDRLLGIVHAADAVLADARAASARDLEARRVAMVLADRLAAGLREALDAIDAHDSHADWNMLEPGRFAEIRKLAS